MNWLNLLANSLWIASLAVALAVAGYARWRGAERGNSLLQAFYEPGPQFCLRLAGLMFCAGLAFSWPAGWGRALWLAPAAWFAFLLVGLRSANNRSGKR